jgi:hypothetical protein
MKVPKALKEDWELVGGLSSPSKMPCFGFSTPAEKCKTGSKLRKVKNSVCSKCYALKGFYAYSGPRKALKKRYDNLYKDGWVQAMTNLIKNLSSNEYFRWFDSGDVDSLIQLENIVQIAKNLPNIKFWLPTKEYSFVNQYLAIHGKFPDNLNVRLSGFMIDGIPLNALAKRLGLTTSQVSGTNPTCPASSQNNKCLSCRACWDKNIENVTYKKH